jgi:hypothetical protein
VITLRADNRVLVNNSKFAYLTQNYQSNVASVAVSNTEPFVVGTPILLGEMGQTDAEVLKVNDITGTTITLGDVDNVAVNTVYSHPESTRMIALPYDQIQFYWTDILGTIADENPTFNDSTPLTGWVAFDPTSYYSTYSDSAHSQGFGWFMYKNATTDETSEASNPIPYAGFTLNTAQQVFADFESLLNTNELKLVSMNDKFAWLNESLAVLKNKLNLTNAEYTVSTPQTITTVGGTAEYILPSDFADMVEITDVDGKEISFVTVSDVMVRNGTLPTTTKYYIRGRYIGFSPIPTETGVIFYYTYRAKATRVTSLSTYIDLPDNAFYSLKDWMMYRAYMKFNNPLATAYYQSFKNAMDIFIESAVKRDANLDVWGIDNTANT